VIIDYGLRKSKQLRFSNHDSGSRRSVLRSGSENCTIPQQNTGQAYSYGLSCCLDGLQALGAVDARSIRVEGAFANPSFRTMTEFQCCHLS